MITAVISIAASIVLFSFSMQFYVENSITNSDFDYELIVPQSSSYYVVRGYDAYNVKGCITWHDFDKLNNTDGIDKVFNKNVYTCGLALELPSKETDNYWNQWIKNQNYDEAYGHSLELPDVDIVNRISYYVVNESEFNYLNNEYFSNGLEYEDYLKSNFILFLPPSNEQERVKEADVISFGRLSLDGDIHSPYYENFSLRLANIVNRSLNIQKDTQLYIYDTPVVVMTEKTARENGIFLGYNYINVTVDKNTSNIHSIEENLKNIVAKVPQSLYVSNAEYQARNIEMNKIIIAMSSLLCSIFWVFGVFSMYFTFRNRLTIREKEIAVMEAIGLNNDTIKNVLYIENIIYIIVATLISCLLLGIISLSLSWGLSYALQYSNEILLSCVLMIIVNRIVISYPIKKILNTDVGIRLKYNE